MFETHQLELKFDTQIYGDNDILKIPLPFKNLIGISFANDSICTYKFTIYKDKISKHGYKTGKKLNYMESLINENSFVLYPMEPLTVLENVIAYIEVLRLSVKEHGTLTISICRIKQKD